MFLQDFCINVLLQNFFVIHFLDLDMPGQFQFYSRKRNHFDNLPDLNHLCPMSYCAIQETSYVLIIAGFAYEFSSAFIKLSTPTCV